MNSIILKIILYQYDVQAVCAIPTLQLLNNRIISHIRIISLLFIFTKVNFNPNS